ncbi:MAG: GCN5-related N-acetyltransferase [Humibacillus sp.]|nr:GCN5-related N-acetyltransferase [Humibacillus sp.]
MPDLRALTPDRVGDLVGDCAPCTFWQTVPHHGHREARDPLDVLTAWVEEVCADWGPPGRVVYDAGVPVGHVVLAPARLVPRLAAFATAPSDPATVMLLAATTRDPGLRKTLVHAAAKDVLRQGGRALDVVAARPVALGRHACVLEAAPLERLGFRVERDHPAYPRLRMELRTVVTLREGAAAYVARALARIPGVAPAPEPQKRL